LLSDDWKQSREEATVQEILTSFEIERLRGRRKRRLILLAAVLCFVGSFFCGALSIVGKAAEWEAIFSYAGIILFIATVILLMIHAGLPSGDAEVDSVGGFGIASRILFLVGCLSIFVTFGLFIIPVALFLGAFGCSMISHFNLLDTHKFIRFVALGSVFFLIIGSVCLSKFRSMFEFIPLFWMPASLLGLLVHILSFRYKSLWNRLWSMVAILTLIAGLIILVPSSCNSGLPRIYTPPALSISNLTVFKECIRFIDEHDECANIVIWRGHAIICNEKPHSLWSHDGYEDEEQILSKEAINMLRHISDRLGEVGCVKCERDSDMIVFWQLANSIWPLDPGFLLALYPAPPGVLYSLSGEDPNTLDSDVLNPLKPFSKIQGNWYCSRNLMITGPRLDVQRTRPKSLIDHSLCIGGLDMEEPNNAGYN